MLNPCYGTSTSRMPSEPTIHAFFAPSDRDGYELGSSRARKLRKVLLVYLCSLVRTGDCPTTVSPPGARRLMKIKFLYFHL